VKEGDAVIRLVCPKCGFVVETFDEEDLKDVRKEKRYRALLKRVVLCAGCNRLVSGLREVKE